MKCRGRSRNWKTWGECEAGHGFAWLEAGEMGLAEL